MLQRLHLGLDLDHLRQNLSEHRLPMMLLEGLLDARTSQHEKEGDEGSHRLQMPWENTELRPDTGHSNRPC